MVDDDRWRPRCRTPRGLVLPVAIDPAGLAGPTRGQAQGPRWRRTSRNLYVPASAPACPEQRVVEAAGLLPGGAMVTGWAALRLFGGGFFDGLGADGRSLIAVPLLVGQRSRPRPAPGVRWVRDSALPDRPWTRAGVRCAPPERAVLDAMRLAGDLREAVVALDMAAAAEITSVRRVRAALDGEVRRPGWALVREALGLADEASRSPAETRTRLVYVLDAGLPAPLVNCGVHGPDGRLLAVADLLDDEAGVAGEYDGALHRGRSRHRRDNDRLEAFKAVGIETFTVVAGDDRRTVVDRMLAAHLRAARADRAGRPRRWRVRPPTGPTLDERLDRRDLAERLADQPTRRRAG